MGFIKQYREELTPRRAKIVHKVIDSLDKAASGSINVSDIVNVFDVSQNPAYIERRKTRDQLIHEFLSNFEDVRNG
jgi:Ca2+-binding EF-hand superfamily protein